MFIDRKDAGEKLSKALAAYRDKGALVLGIPRGGAAIAYYVARYLNADLALIITRKLGHPSNPEAAFGAVAEDGSVYLSDYAENVSEEEISDILEREKKEIERRISKLRKGKPLPNISGRTVILADDGIATGATLFSAIALCKKKKAGKIVVAAPISGQRMVYELGKMVDDVIILETPSFFYAVGQGYEYFSSLSDEETIGFVEKWEEERLKKAS
ncbi:MAG: phosphoribosyltransferase family protein [Cyclobacteriaceae bacterium]|jgi:putative phosphoribosyl transferase|nr:phosphoribosyltransferase family protein [Cyclobacteriaceae bacterium]MDH4298422.1 phosphoribosyltransferase family protein [Cyclobacteriaceae bacterium]MDH5248230.1 phosphoribosyltransferase family protein [Cyclobacteriaceae bacterium]